MSLKKRLIFSNAAIVMIPIVITVVASFAFISISSKFFNIDVNYKNMETFTNIHYQLFEENGSILREHPEKLLEKGFQQDLAAKLAAVNADVLIMKKNTVIFSTREISKIDIEKCIDTGKGTSLNHTLNIDGNSYITRTFSVTFKDQDTGSVILLAPVQNSEIHSGQFIIFILIVFLGTFLVTNILFSYSLSNRILKPVKKLQVAADEISRGNLDYDVVEDGDNEIRELCRSYELMRLRLKESVYTQMKYDDNRRMLVSSISHDLKTPITSIKGYVEGILDGIANTPEKVDKYLKTVHSKASQVDEMIDDLLLYSKLDLKQMPFNFEKTDITHFFKDCVEENTFDLSRNNISIELRNELKKCNIVNIDREKLRRVLTNLIDNARKYMDKEDGKIDILLRETRSGIIIEIRDNGAGIDREDLLHIFDKFYRADSSRNRISGSGLGLAIAKQIVEGHGGKIWAISQKDRGTSIMISLECTA